MTPNKKNSNLAVVSVFTSFFIVNRCGVLWLRRFGRESCVSWSGVCHYVGAKWLQWVVCVCVCRLGSAGCSSVEVCGW